MRGDWRLKAQVKQRHPNIILIVMDTARADHLSCYGYHRKTTPNIDEIAKHGVLYQNAFTPAPWTPPSHASIFTGKYPSHHKTIGKDVSFNTENTSLAEILGEHGYHTVGITCCQILGPGSNFEKGFSEYVELKERVLGNSKFRRLLLKEVIRKFIHGRDACTGMATEVIKNFLRNRQKRPLFLFVNYFTCHTPYEPPRPFRKQFCRSCSGSKFYFQEYLANKILGKTTEKLSDSDLNVEKLKWIASGGGGLSFAARETSISEKEWEVVKSWYDGEMAYLDFQIGNLGDFLVESDLFDDTLLMITSDHGESFGEHGLAVHPLGLYDNVIHVPLIVCCPSIISREKRVSSLVSTIDIFPTLLEVAGINSQPAIQGRSLYPFENRRIHDFVCAEYGGLHGGGFAGLKAWKISPATRERLGKIDRGCKCIRNTALKYIWSPLKEELYDLLDDPSEEKNIAEQHPEMVTSLKERLQKTVDIEYFGSEEFREKEEMLNRLRALGYI
jgi:arylsulfatase A-like enzyme